MSAPISFLIVNLVGGTAVLGGYLICLYMFPDQRETLWGAVQGGWRSVFAVSMLIAAAGYLAFLYVILFKSSPVEFSSRFLDTKHAISIICMIFLISAATWMPATITYLKTSNSSLLHLPGFIIGFIFMIVLISFNILSNDIILILKYISKFLFTIAMAGIGLKISFNNLLRNGEKIFQVAIVGFIFQIICVFIAVSIL